MRRLSPALKREVDGFAFAYRAYFPEFFFPPACGELSNFESEMRRLRGVDQQMVCLEFAIALIGAQAAGEEILRDPAALEAPDTRRRLRERAASSSWPSAARSVRRSSSITGSACHHRRGSAPPRASTLPVPRC